MTRRNPRVFSKKKTSPAQAGAPVNYPLLLVVVALFVYILYNGVLYDYFHYKKYAHACPPAA